MRHAPQTLLRREDGAIAVTVALLMTVLLGMGALAIDVASFHLTKRQLQAATDTAALAGTYALTTTTGPTTPQTWVTDYLTRNYQGPGQPTAPNPVVGYYCPDGSLTVAQRFTTSYTGCSVYPSISGVTPATNAVRVTSTTDTPLYLGRVLMPGTSSLTIGATATAAQIPQAGFYAGSGVLSLNAGLLNTVLSGLLGGNINLSVASYNGLLNANISAFSFFQALQTNIGVSAGTYDSLLQSTVSVQQVLQAGIDALNQPNSVASLALQSLQAQIVGSPTVKLSNLFDLGVWQSQGIDTGNVPTALQATLNAYQLATLTAQVADGSNFIGIPSFSTSVLGLATLTVSATVIEPPVSAPFVFGPVGMSVHTSQVRLQANLSVPVTSILTSVLGSSPLQVPMYIEVAEGDAVLSQISCGNPATVTIDATPGLAKAYIGVATGSPMTNFTNPVTVSPATLLSVNLLGLGLVKVTVTGDATVSSGAGVATPLTFTQADITAGTIHTATSNSSLLATLLPALMNTGLTVTVSPLGLGISTAAVASALNTLLSPVFDGLDLVVGQILTALGIQIGYLDVTATGVRCNAPALVN